MFAVLHCDVHAVFLVQPQRVVPLKIEHHFALKPTDHLPRNLDQSAVPIHETDNDIHVNLSLKFVQINSREVLDLDPQVGWNVVGARLILRFLARLRTVFLVWLFYLY